MGTLYLDIHLEKPSPSHSFQWHIQTVHNESLLTPAQIPAEPQVNRTGMLLAGTPNYWQ